MSVHLQFGSKFWLQPAGNFDKKEGKLVHAVVRAPGTKEAKKLPPLQLLPVSKNWNGVWKVYAIDHAIVSIPAQYIVGWCSRGAAVDLGFLAWSWARFHEEVGVNQSPSGQAPDKYWGGLQIYSYLEQDWPTWLKLTAAPMTTSNPLIDEATKSNLGPKL